MVSLNSVIVDDSSEFVQFNDRKHLRTRHEVAESSCFLAIACDVLPFSDLGGSIP
jgi:hypothetical protein